MDESGDARNMQIENKIRIALLYELAAAVPAGKMEEHWYAVQIVCRGAELNIVGLR